jgi:hypothetical protein
MGGRAGAVLRTRIDRTPARSHFCKSLLKHQTTSALTCPPPDRDAEHPNDTRAQNDQNDAGKDSKPEVPTTEVAFSFDHFVGEGEKRRRDREPIAFAVLRLMTNSNLDGWTTGKSAGFSPLRIVARAVSSANLANDASLQLHRHPAKLAGEFERRRVTEVDRRAGVLADVLPLVQRVFEGSRLFDPAFADLPAVGEERNRPALAHPAAV